eukprot:491588_1
MAVAITDEKQENTTSVELSPLLSAEETKSDNEESSVSSMKFMKQWLKLNKLDKSEAIVSALKNHKITFKNMITFSTTDITAFCESIEATFTEKQLLKKSMLLLPKPQAEEVNQVKQQKNETFQHELANRVEAYLTYEVASSLIFGFSVSVLFADAKEENFEEEYLEILFTLLMNFALLLSAYSLIVVSITHYFVSRYVANYKYTVANWYLAYYFKQRQYARWSFYLSIIFLILALALYLFEQLSLKNGIISAAILGLGALFLVYIMFKMVNPHRFSDSAEEKEDAENVSLIEQISICLVFRYGEMGASTAYNEFFDVDKHEFLANIQLLFDEQEAILEGNTYINHNEVDKLLLQINPKNVDEIPFEQFECWYEKLVCAVNSGVYSWNIGMIEARKHKKSSRKATVEGVMVKDRYSNSSWCKCFC